MFFYYYVAAVRITDPLLVVAILFSAEIPSQNTDIVIPYISLSRPFPSLQSTMLLGEHWVPLVCNDRWHGSVLC